MAHGRATLLKPCVFLLGGGLWATVERVRR